MNYNTMRVNLVLLRGFTRAKLSHTIYSPLLSTKALRA